MHANQNRGVRSAPLLSLMLTYFVTRLHPVKLVLPFPDVNAGSIANNYKMEVDSMTSVAEEPFSKKFKGVV